MARGERRGLLPCCAAVLALAAGVARAADPAPADDAARIERLEREVSDLRRMVRDLLDERQSASAPQAASGHASGSESAAAPELRLRGFGHVQYDVDQTKPAGLGSDTTNHFTNGGLDLFVTSQLSERFGFLSEILFEFEEGGETALDVERLLLQYEHADWLHAAVGRGHTALGYWNQRYHHGAWMYTTTDRPLLFLFEDDGGILPVHFVGLELSGNLETEPGVFSYVLDVANGRGPTTTHIQLIEDLNDSKLVGGMLRFSPFAIEGLEFGANGLFDVIPPEPGVLTRLRPIDEIIAGVHVVYVEDPYEILAEAQYVRHDDATSRRRYESAGAYIQLAYRMGRLTPYYRFDWLGIDPGDPFYANVPAAETSLQHTAGFRFDWTTWVALKLEYRRLDTRSHDSNAVTAQAAFAF